MPEDQDNPSDSDGCPAYATSALHTDSMLFDEEILLKGLDVYKTIAWLGVTMERRRQSAVYSPGGCGCGLLLLPGHCCEHWRDVCACWAGCGGTRTVYHCHRRDDLALPQSRATPVPTVNQCRLGRIPDHCVPAECQLPGVLCPVDDQCLYRGIRHGGLMHCQQTVVQSAFARRLDNCIGRLLQP